MQFHVVISNSESEQAADRPVTEQGGELQQDTEGAVVSISGV